MPVDSDYERGKKEGRVDALLDEHTVRLNKINGSIERHAESNERLANAMKTGFDKLAGEMRVMQEEARARDLAVDVARETLAKETERRREELAASAETVTGTWSLRSNKAQVVYLFVTIASLVYAILKGTGKA